MNPSPPFQPGQVAVVTAETPKGPWHDQLGKPLLSDELGRSLNPRTTFRDPCVFEDDNGAFYIIAGVFEYYVTRLGEDMVSLAETPRHVVVNNPYGPCGDGKTDDKPFIHKENNTYYLSWVRDYQSVCMRVYMFACVLVMCLCVRAHV